MTVLAAHSWPTNADLIVDVARLGYLRTDWLTLDPTFGLGTWWKKWQPDHLVACDLDPKKSPLGRSINFTRLPMRDSYFQAVTFDPPYKLNGAPTADVDERYGVHVYQSREARHGLILRGVTECARVLARGGHLLVKVQDQVNGGHVRWQADMVTEHARDLGLVKVDAFHMLGGRPQPERFRPGCPVCSGKVSRVKAGRKCRHHGVVVPVEVTVAQEHASRNLSTLLVLRRVAA